VHIPEQLNLGPVSVAGVDLPDAEPALRLQSAHEPATPVKEPPPGKTLCWFYERVTRIVKIPSVFGFSLKRQGHGSEWAKSGMVG
jgi:hypothetical protein